MEKRFERVGLGRSYTSISLAFSIGGCTAGQVLRGGQLSEDKKESE